MSIREVVKETSSIVVCATVIVECSVDEMNKRSFDVLMLVIEVPEIIRVDRITVMNGSEIKLLPSIKLLVIVTVPKNEETNASYEVILVLLSKDIVDCMLTNSTLLVTSFVMFITSRAFSLNSLSIKQKSTQIKDSVKNSSAAIARFPYIVVSLTTIVDDATDPIGALTALLFRMLE